MKETPCLYIKSPWAPVVSRRNFASTQLTRCEVVRSGNSRLACHRDSHIVRNSPSGISLPQYAPLQPLARGREHRWP